VGAGYTPGILIRPGKDRYSKCETIGSVLDIQEGKIDGVYKPNLLVGASTDSHAFITG
jgi:hypothetical protein